jgi:hypothetical protein
VLLKACITGEAGDVEPTLSVLRSTKTCPEGLFFGLSFSATTNHHRAFVNRRLANMNQKYDPPFFEAHFCSSSDVVIPHSPSSSPFPSYFLQKILILILLEVEFAELPPAQRRGKYCDARDAQF